MIELQNLSRVAVDESGNTGEALLDAQQPIYVLASTSLTDDESATVISKAGRDVADELKYTRLRRSRRGREFVRGVEVQLSPSMAKVAVVNKPFMIMAKLVDTLVEPLAARTDFNLYADGAHLALAELWHAVIPVFCGEDRYIGLLNAFVTMCRSRSKPDIAEFYRYVKETASRTEYERMRDDLELILATRVVVADGGLTEPGSDLDPAIPSLFVTAIEWGKELHVPFMLVHDESRAISRWMPEFERFLFSSAPVTHIGQGDRGFQLPLLAAGVELVDSRTSHAVQVADLVAGATREWLTNRARSDGDDESEESELLMPLIVNAVWPTGDISPDRTTGPANPADETARFLSGRPRRPRTDKP